LIPFSFFAFAEWWSYCPLMRDKSKKRQENNCFFFYHNTYKAGEQRWKAMKHKFKEQLITLKKM
ncbi:hypothetical protein, partial [Bacillus cereus]|uniref:hypothetical protein n=1 Tax=Bacillus cereus TaxID=1396 RepID=UPI001E578F56